MNWRSFATRLGPVVGGVVGISLLGVTPAHADPRVDYAPLVYLQLDETHWPMSATTFVNHSSLKWEHATCTPNEHVIAGMGNITASSMASSYHHQEELGCDARVPGPPVHGTTFYANNYVKPYMQGGPNGGRPETGTVGQNSSSEEGMFLNLDNNYRDGQGPQWNEPVYARFISGNRLEYWFNYGNSHPLMCPGCAHEGDWEHIALKLGADNVPTKVEYFIHHKSCTLSFAEARRDGNHVRIVSAREAHASYPAGGVAGYTDDISGPTGMWKTWNNVDRVQDQPWWGYMGSWGQVGSAVDFTGPMGPNAKQPAPTFKAARCSMYY